MKISRTWLQTYFEAPLPDAQALANALTFHAFEIESVEGDILDVKVTPNRGHDCLSHRGIAKEFAAVLKLPMKSDPLRSSVSLEPETDAFKARIEDAKLCPRFTGAYIKNLRVGPSPDWLRIHLETMGQKSINNVVDATNFVMFDIGQPLHAFDAGKLTKNNDGCALVVRSGKTGERMLGLDEKEYLLTEQMGAIADAGTGEVVSIAGIKGGKPTGIDERTTEIILEAANWNSVAIRKTSQALKLRTDASSRFEQGMSAEYAPYGLRAAADLIVQLAGGEIAGFVDEYPNTQEGKKVSVSVEKVNQILGTELTGADVADVFMRLGFAYKEEGGVFDVIAPFERLDILIAEDLVEEIGRIIGYDKIPATELSPFPQKPEINANFYSAEKMREELVTQGYSEVFTSVFADRGERAVANKVDSAHPYLRANLADGLQDALERNARNKDLLGLKEVKLFEIGTVWKNDTEVIMLGTADGKNIQEVSLSGADASLYQDLPISETERYQPFSKYPFIVRDIALWCPQRTEPVEVLEVIKHNASELLVRGELFDTFEKGEKLSLAFRLIFQSFEKTLTDAEVNGIMKKVSEYLQGKGYEIR